MKVVINIVALALSLAGTSSGVYAHELRGGVVVLSDVTADANVEEGCRRYDCREDKQYYKDHRSCCNNKNAPYDSHGPRYGHHKCEDNYDYWKTHKAWCIDHGYRYGGGGWHNRDYDDKCDYWKEHNRAKWRERCKDALSDFFENYEDADLIAHILTGVYDEEDFQDEDFQDEDFNDLEESQDE